MVKNSNKATKSDKQQSKHLPILFPPGLKVSCSCALNPQRSIKLANAGCTASNFNLSRGVPAVPLKPPDTVPCWVMLPGELTLQPFTARGASSLTLTRSCRRGVRLQIPASFARILIRQPGSFSVSCSPGAEVNPDTLFVRGICASSSPSS